MRFCILGLCLLVVAAQAGSLENKKTVIKWETELEKSPKLITEKCGTSIPLQFDSASYVSGGFVEAKKNPGSICRELAHAVYSLCEDAVAKPIVLEKIKKINCTASKDKDVNVTLKEGTFNIAFGPQATNVGEKAREYLKANL